MDNISALMGLVYTVISAVLIWKIKSQSEKNDKFTQDITTLQTTAVTDEHVRKVMREEMQQLNIALPELVKVVREIEKYIAERRGYDAGYVAAKRRATDGSIE
jgi:uncharacterized protein YqfB (UPF0267 family)